MRPALPRAGALRDAALALVASRALVWAVGVSAYLLLHLSSDIRYDHAGLTHSFGGVGNALAAPAVRWDSNWYVDISEHGYRHEDVEPAFFPTSLFFSAVYTEALFLALELGAFVAARRGRWAWAGVLGGLGAATRNTGWLLAPVLLALYLYGPRADAEPGAPRSRWRPRYPLRPDALWLALVPLGLAGYLIFMQVHFGDALAPWHAQAHFRRSFDGPLSALWEGGVKAWHGVEGIVGGTAPFGSAARKIGQFVVVCGALGATVGVVRRLPGAYGLYALLSIVPVLSFPYPPGPLASSLRYIVVIFPLFMWLGMRLRDVWAYALVLAAFAAMLVYATAMFATWHFVA